MCILCVQGKIRVLVFSGDTDACVPTVGKHNMRHIDNLNRVLRRNVANALLEHCSFCLDQLRAKSVIMQHS